MEPLLSLVISSLLIPNSFSNNWINFSDNSLSPPCPNCRQPIQLTNEMVDDFIDGFYDVDQLHNDLVVSFMIRDIKLFIHDFNTRYNVNGNVNGNVNNILNTLNSIVLNSMVLNDVDNINIDIFYNDINENILRDTI